MLTDDYLQATRYKTKQRNQVRKGHNAFYRDTTDSEFHYMTGEAEPDVREGEVSIKEGLYS